MPEGTTTVFLHVGCRKSGTTALQLALRSNVATLRRNGLAQPLVGRGATLRGLVDPLNRALENGGDPAEARDAVARLADRIRDSEQPRQLVTLEALAELPADLTSIVLDGLAEFDTRLIVTVRPWAVTIPSEWQQRVKSRFTADYLDYVRAIRDPKGVSAALAEEAAHFRRRQDVADIAARWRSGRRELPVHVILVPQDRNARPGLLELFCQVVGVDPADLPVPGRRGVNPSLSREDAELLRRVNVALGDRLPNARGDYRHGVRKFIAVRAMMRKPDPAGTPIRLPHELAEWASAEAARQVDALRATGCDVLGDVPRFVRPALAAEDYRPVSDAEVADAAAKVLANIAEGEVRSRRRNRRRARKRRSGRARRDDAGLRNGRRAPTALRAVARRVARRLGGPRSADA